MSYHVAFSKRALKDFKKLDKPTSALILGWIRKNLEGCTDLRAHGKELTANHSGEWRYRIGDYRMLADIQDGKLIILMLTVGHRSEVYK